jgi:hypothetical protein
VEWRTGGVLMTKKTKIKAKKKAEEDANLGLLERFGRQLTTRTSC